MAYRRCFLSFAAVIALCVGVQTARAQSCALADVPQCDQNALCVSQCDACVPALPAFGFCRPFAFWDFSCDCLTIPWAQTSCCAEFCSSPVYSGVRRSLFNGVDLTGWTNVKGEAPGEGWKVVDGMIFREKDAGDLYVDGKFENFILEFEFKISEKGNSGVKYRSWNTEGFGLGCEYQIFDDINVPDNPPRYQTGSLYDVVVPREGAPKIKMGEFNKGKIIVCNNHFEHYLNDELVMSIDYGTDEWKELVEKSKFKDEKEFGATEVGRIFLQDHNCQVWFKNLYITELKPEVCGSCIPCGCF